MLNYIEALKRERERLLDDWLTASGNEKQTILTRITRIDEELENHQKRSKVAV